MHVEEIALYLRTKDIRQHNLLSWFTPSNVIFFVRITGTNISPETIENEVHGDKISFHLHREFELPPVSREIRSMSEFAL